MSRYILDVLNDRVLSFPACTNVFHYEEFQGEFTLLPKGEEE